VRILARQGRDRGGEGDKDVLLVNPNSFSLYNCPNWLVLKMNVQERV